MTLAAIRTEGLTKRFGDVLALDDLTVTVEQGEVFGFLGPNGAGKSTTIRLLLGFLAPTAGTAELMGIPCRDVRRAHRHVGHVPGDVALWPQLTGEEILTLLGNVAGGVDEAFRDELVERFRLDVSRRARSYSKGNRQKVALVAALMSRPDVLLLDEPTAGLDPLMEEEFQAVVREASGRGQTVLLSSHILDEVEDLCHRVAILREGRLVEVAALDDLRRLSTTELEASFTGDVPDLADLPGVTRLEQLDHTLRLTVSGSPAPVLERLATAGVSRLRSHEPSLEEIFLTYYASPS